MLQKLLAEIRKGGTLNPSALATGLNVSPALVEMMLEDLERRGILSRLASQCPASGCGECSASAACAPRVWTVNERRAPLQPPA